MPVGKFASYSPNQDCMAPDNRHRLYISLMDRHGWQCQFLEADLKTPLPSVCTSLRRTRSLNWWSGEAVSGTRRAD